MLNVMYDFNRFFSGFVTTHISLAVLLLFFVILLNI
jgi:hypothetical protein